MKIETMSDLMNFRKRVVNYINDNLKFIKEGLNKDASPKELAEASCEHYRLTVEGYDQVDDYLSEEQEEEFVHTAELLFRDGIVPHAGTLMGNEED